MRYSLIHHDIRERFELTMSAYIVCDSIHQLSHGGPTFKTDTDISEFVGIDRSHVGQIRKQLLAKGLVTEVAGGWETTELWKEALLHVPGKFPTKRGKSPQNGEIPHHSIYKEDKEDIYISEDSPKKPRSTLDGFESWWAIWPKRENKLGASAEWRKLSPNERSEAIKGASRVAKVKTDYKFIPMPHKWLANRRWEDEVVESESFKVDKF